MKESRYGMGVDVALPYEQALERTTEELKKEGFGVLTTIDVKQTLKQKLDKEFRRYTILGACNPALAHRALSAEKDIGLLLPCNIIVYEGDTPGTSVVAAMDPIEALSLTGRSDIQAVATEVRERLQKVLEHLEQGATS